MKVQVVLKTESKVSLANSMKVDLVISPVDTVLAVKERIATAHMIAFPEQDLVFEGQVLADLQRLVDCGVKEGSSLGFIVRASEASLIKQLAELLQARDLSCDELGLLYCYKNGVSVSQALKTVGFDGRFVDFMSNQKIFFVENGRVTLVREDTAMKPFSVADEVKVILEATDSGGMDISTLCSKFVQKFNASISSIAGAKPADFLASRSDMFLVTGRGLVSLKPPVQERRRNIENAPSTLLSQYPVPESHGGISTPKEEHKQKLQQVASTQAPVDAQQYLDLHNKISGRSFNSKVTQALLDIVDVISAAMFLNIDHVVKGGSIGKSTAISGVTDADVVFFLKDMPSAIFGKVLPALLKSVASVLSEHFSDKDGVERVRITNDSLQIHVKNLVTVDIRFAPVFDSYSDTIQSLGMQSPDTRRIWDASLAKEKVQFIAKQPGQVKVTMRLLKWWREQQEWSRALTRPSDDILELMAVYSAVQSKPADQRSAIANVMSLFARFSELRIVWSNYYDKDDIWPPLLKHQPLLMDPVNPFVNVADPQVFDPSELVALARTTHFFW